MIEEGLKEIYDSVIVYVLEFLKTGKKNEKNTPQNFMVAYRYEIKR